MLHIIQYNLSLIYLFHVFFLAFFFPSFFCLTFFFSLFVSCMLSFFSSFVSYYVREIKAVPMFKHRATKTYWEVICTINLVIRWK
jgi:hypothetical protein